MSVTTPEPVEATWKISDVLRRYPELLEPLIDAAPEFKRLRNPMLRRVQARLVTVEQAARVAGLEPLGLVRSLNAALGVATPDAPPTGAARPVGGAAPAWVTGADIALRLDIRPLQQRGEEPFGAIMEAMRQVPAGQALALRNTFEPVPLYDILAARGFEHWARRDGPDDWEILIFNTGKHPSSATPPARAADDAPLDWSAPAETLTIDVSELVPPEPMIRILEALTELPPGGRLLVHHLRRPMHLYPRLDELGCRHATREPSPGRVEVLIEKPAMPGAPL